MVEIYNETVKDLLARPPPLPPAATSDNDKARKAALAARKGWAPPQLEVRQLPAERGGGVYLPGAYVRLWLLGAFVGGGGGGVVSSLSTIDI